ncbi:ethionine resistance protein [Entomophthora muscae]|uniref:Ethionine resistance protein n=2 Tax=Entomophthora muscae TaxID=34485 RepID=A0ACC2SJX9_9FUNG|nr:ethionine resistance protein [Entomophthora muscae]
MKETSPLLKGHLSDATERPIYSSIPIEDPSSSYSDITNALKSSRSDLTDEENRDIKVYVKHCWEILKLVLPVSLGYVIEFMNPFISTYAVASLGSEALASSAISSMFANVTGWSIVFGMTTSLDTLCSQAFTGAEDVKILGVYLQRGFLVTISLFLPVSLIWWHAEELLLAIGQEPGLSQLCGLYLKWSLFAVPGFITFECCKKFLQSQGIMNASTQILLLSLPVSVASNFFLVSYPSTSIGFIGAPISSAITIWFCAFMSIGYILFIDGEKAWGGFSLKAFSEWGPILRLGIPGVLQICSEWWAYELLAFGASYISMNALAGHSAVSNISSLFYQVALGGGVVASNLVGNDLGEGLPRRARLSAVCALIVMLFIGSLCSTVIFTFMPFWSTLFNNEPQIVKIVCSLLPIVALFQIGESIAGLGNGVLRGTGRQDLGATMNILVFYFIGIPSGFFLAFYCHLGVQGLWSGFSIGISILAVIAVYIILTTDWVDEARKASIRVGSSEPL